MKRFLSLIVALLMTIAMLPASAEVLRYDMYCGMSATTVEGIPAAAWVQFHPATHEILNVYVTGSSNPVSEGKMTADVSAFAGKTAEDVSTSEAVSAIEQAVVDACKRYLAGASFSIRPYQTMAVDRYIANNPHFDTMTADANIDVSVVAAYPEDCVTVVNEDVQNNGKLTWPAGVYTGAFSYDDASFNVTHNVVLAHKPGIAVIAYTWNGETVLDAVDVFENFTLHPEVLSGSDSYGKVVASSIEDDVVTYIALGDKAMNFPGGTAGSTLVSVSVDVNTRKIVKVYDLASSDSTYLSNAWEYGGGFTTVGDMLYAINDFTAYFAGHNADDLVTKYDLSVPKEGVVGGVVVEGGVDVIMTGATRTANAIISAVNAAQEAFQADYPVK